MDQDRTSMREWAADWREKSRAEYEAMRARIDLEAMREHLPEVDVDHAQQWLGWGFVGGGVGMAAYSIARGKRGWLMWILPAALISGGLALLVGRGVRHRSEHIMLAEDRVRAELASLDPFARWQVLRDIGREHVPGLTRN